MFDILNEEAISLTELAKKKNVNTCTTWRWAGRGVSGIRLETYSLGGRRFTSIPAFERWVRQVSLARGGELQKPQTNRQRTASITAAKDELEAAGI